MSALITITSATLVVDPAVRSTTTGKTVTNARIAVDDGFGDKKKSYFFDVVAWESLGEQLGQLQKGQKLGVYGKLTSRQYEKDGQKRTVIEIVANALEIRDVRKTDSRPQPETVPDSEIPF